MRGTSAAAWFILEDMKSPTRLDPRLEQTQVPQPLPFRHTDRALVAERIAPCDMGEALPAAGTDGVPVPERGLDALVMEAQMRRVQDLRAQVRRQRLPEIRQALANDLLLATRTLELITHALYER
jgi:hypothetical protein